MSSSSEEDDAIEYPTMEEPAKARFRNGKRGAPVLIDPNCYQYKRNKMHEKVTNWVCVLKPNCKGACATENASEMIVRWTGHNHDPDPVQLKVQEAEAEIMEAAKNHPTLRTSHLVTEWQKKTLDPAEKAYLPSKRTMERRVKRAKKEAKGHPNCPKSFEDLANIPERCLN
jgi:FLYWCH zinc finger domain